MKLIAAFRNFAKRLIMTVYCENHTNTRVHSVGIILNLLMLNLAVHKLNNGLLNIWYIISCNAINIPSVCVCVCVCVCVKI